MEPPSLLVLCTSVVVRLTTQFSSEFSHKLTYKVSELAFVNCAFFFPLTWFNCSETP